MSLLSVYRSLRLKRHIKKHGSKNKGYFQCFDQRIIDWQKQLIWLINAPVIKYWFRHKLRIDQDAESKGKYISEIKPDKYIIDNDDGSKTMITRTHHKYSKRLYYGFAPIWWVVHFLDWLFIDKHLPEWSFGFYDLTLYSETTYGGSYTCDGYYFSTSSSSGQSWSASRTDTALGDTNALFIRCGYYCGSVTNQFRYLYRGVLTFDVNLYGSAYVATSAILSVAGQSAEITWDYPQNITGHYPVTYNDLINDGCYLENFGTVRFMASDWALSDFSIGSYNECALNSAGKAHMISSRVISLAFRSTPDLDNFQPSWAASYTKDRVMFDSVDQTGTSSDPKLVVVYDLPAVATFIPQTINII
ncbi:MAG: hypothetical protein KKA84_12145 [Bacteroidetes bacterium]|nr:hypothetical protein [Bacteroidota bacterium]